jgi:DNA ligase (NAD+)
MQMQQLVETLQKANWMYHNTDKILMTDDEYDRGLEQLRKINPAHPFLSLVGASSASCLSAKSEVLLPRIMGSLDKIRYGEGLDRWKKKFSGNPKYIITEKLDGLSALLVCQGKVKKLYLRGDGVKGVDVSFVLSHLHLPVANGDYMIRGELVLPLAATPPGSIGRSLINGWLHRSASALAEAKASVDAKPEGLASIHFVAYEVIEPVLTRSAQLTWLTTHGFRTPWARPSLASSELNEELAKEILVTRRCESTYPLDGIVIGVDCIPAPVGGGEAKNPTDCIAFKAALDEQRETTTVVQVEWNASRQGMLVPRIEIQPVVIGGARIQWLSGHNAALINKNGIGPGARIVVRRSGDVIPTLDSVIEKASGGAAMPPASLKWSWDKTETHAMLPIEELGDSILHSLQTLGVDGLGPGLVDKLLEAGLNTMKKLWDATPTKLADIIGPGRGPLLHSSLRECVGKATQMQLLIASNMLPRGVGERKLRLLYARDGDAAKWSAASLEGVAGWSKGSLEELLAVLPAALEWKKCFGVGANANAAPAPAVAASAVAATLEKFVVFTGARDKELEGRLSSLGWGLQDTVNKKTTVVVAESLDSQSGKAKKARDLGIRIMLLQEFRALLLAQD